VGWAVALFQVIAGINQAGSLTGAYATAGETVGKNFWKCRNVHCWSLIRLSSRIFLIKGHVDLPSLSILFYSVQASFSFSLFWKFYTLP
jgi:hypothetical protein